MYQNKLKQIWMTKLMLLVMYKQGQAQIISNCEFKLWTFLRGTESRVATFLAKTICKPRFISIFLNGTLFFRNVHSDNEARKFRISNDVLFGISAHYRWHEISANQSVRFRSIWYLDELSQIKIKYKSENTTNMIQHLNRHHPEYSTTSSSVSSVCLS